MLGGSIEPGDYYPFFEIYPGGFPDWLSYMFGGSPTAVMASFCLQMLSVMILPLLTDTFVNTYFLPILHFIMLLSSDGWIVGVGCMALCSVVRTLFTVDYGPRSRVWRGKKPPRLKPKPYQRLSGKKWRAMMRRRLRLLNPSYGRVYFDRGKYTKLRRKRSKLLERVRVDFYKLARRRAALNKKRRAALRRAYFTIGGAYKVALDESFGGQSTQSDWSPTEDYDLKFGPMEFELGGFCVDEADDTDDVDVVQDFVASLDNPSRLVANFIAMSPREHAKNVEAALLRAEIMFNESKSSSIPLSAPTTARRKKSDAFLARYRDTPCVVDTGASYGLTPFKEDFLTYEECDITVKAVANDNKVIGMGIVLYKMPATNGDTCFVPGIAYHMPDCNIRLLSPQSYHQMYNGHSELDGQAFTFFLAKAVNGPMQHQIKVPIDPGSNLPLLRDVSTTGLEKQRARPHFVQSIRMHQHFCGSFFGRWRTSYDPDDDEGEDDVFEFRPFLHEVRSLNSLNCVTQGHNPNLSNGQKELLLWHYRLNCSLKRVQHLMNEHVRVDEDGNETVIEPVIQTQFAEAKTCSTDIKCATCEIARARVQKPKTSKSTRNKSKDKALTKEKYAPGDFVSMDTVPVGIAGRAYQGYGGPNAGVQFRYLTLFHDAASGVIKIYLQENGSTAATLYAKQQFEDFMFVSQRVFVKHYHSDQGSNFTDEKFAADCASKIQTQSFSGTGAKFENGAAERAVQTVFWMARSMMLHCALRWDLEGCADPSLWPQALLHAVWLYNRTPKIDTCVSPLELLTSRRDDHHDLLRTKVWGCPSFVLDPILQDGKKLPKFSRRTRVGQFMGFSENHSTLVGQIRNLKSGSITNQYHVVYDEKFESVIGLAVNTHAEDLEVYTQKLWELLFDTEYARDFYSEPVVSATTGELEYDVPVLDDEWLTEQEVREKEERIQAQLRRDAQRKARYEAEFRPRTREAGRKVKVGFDDDANSSVPAPTPAVVDGSVEEVPAILPPEGEVSEDAVGASEGDVGNVDFDVGVKDSPGDGDTIWNRRARRSNWKTRYSGSEYVTHAEVTKTNWQHALDFGGAAMATLSLAEKAVLRSPAFSEFFSNFELTLMNERQMPTHLKNNPLTRDRVRYPDESLRMNLTQHKQLARDQAQVDLRYHKLEEVAPTLEALLNSRLSEYVTLATNNTHYSGSTTELICIDVHPAFMTAKLGISKADNPSWDEAMRGPEAAEFWKAAEVEIATLEKMKSWEVVDRPADKKVLPSLWAFRKKRLPSGEVRKYKARFTACGNKQTPDVDFSETWAPVVQWTTVRMMLILSTQMRLKSFSADVSCAFLHSDIDSEVYVEMPRGFKKPGKVLKLLKSLYGLKQAPRLFWKYLTDAMNSCGLVQSEFDPCLFVGPKVIALAYVDDILFFAKDEADIEKLMLDLRNTGLLLEKESSAAGFLGVDIKPTKFNSAGEATELELTQCGLIDRIITNLGLDDKDYSKATPVESSKPLARDADGDPCIEDFNYAAVVGQLLYLSGHTRPELAYAVNQCARYMFNPKRSHELALIRIGKYLKGTRTKGLIVKPSGGLLNINAYPDADFAGLYGHESPDDPACVKSRTGFVILVANCPICWKSTLQSKTALSTTEAEISALAHCMKELIGIMDLAKFFADYYELEPVETKINVTVHEDNSAALILANTIPPECTPRSKFYHIETIWFREQIVLRGIEVVKIDTHEQLGDIFTKDLSKVVFEYLRLKLCGW